MNEHSDNQLDVSLLKMVGNVAALKIDIMSQIVKASSKRLVSDSELANLFNINEVSVSDLKSHKFESFLVDDLLDFLHALDIEMAVSFSHPEESQVNKPPKSIDPEVWIRAVKTFSTEESALEWLESKLGIFNNQTALGICETEKGKQWVMGCLRKIETGEFIS